MSKLLNQFANDAQLGWDSFKNKHKYHVLVLLPRESSDVGSISTTGFATRPPEIRPPISDNYRVGILKRRFSPKVDGQGISVGRDKDNDIVVRDIEVSKVHAFFESGNQGAWTIRDNGSTNGTYLNGALIQPGQKTKIKSSDAIKIGPGLSSVFFEPGDFYQFLVSPAVRDGVY